MLIEGPGSRCGQLTYVGCSRSRSVIGSQRSGLPISCWPPKRIEITPIYPRFGSWENCGATFRTVLPPSQYDRLLPERRNKRRHPPLVFGCVEVEGCARRDAEIRVPIAAQSVGNVVLEEVQLGLELDVGRCQECSHLQRWLTEPVEAPIPGRRLLQGRIVFRRAVRRSANRVPKGCQGPRTPKGYHRGKPIWPKIPT